MSSRQPESEQIDTPFKAFMSVTKRLPIGCQIVVILAISLVLAGFAIWSSFSDLRKDRILDAIELYFQRTLGATGQLPVTSTTGVPTVSSLVPIPPTIVAPQFGNNPIILPTPTSPTTVPTPDTRSPASTPTSVYGSLGNWIILVAGGLLTPQNANTHASKYKSAGYDVAVIYRSRDYRVATVGYTTKNEVDTALLEVKKLNPDAYIHSIADWCPVRIQRENYVECRTR
jgi:hypothetical protein